MKTPKAFKTIEKRKKTKHKENELKSRKLFFENFSSRIGRGSPAKFNSKTNILLIASTSRMPQKCADQWEGGLQTRPGRGTQRNERGTLIGLDGVVEGNSTNRIGD